MRQRHVTEQAALPGYDDIQRRSNTLLEDERLNYSFAPNQAYDAYLRIHKVFVGEAGGRYLEELGYQLQDETMPQYLDAAGWAFAESALVQKERSTVQRLDLLNHAEESWRRALEIQDAINNNAGCEWLCEDSVPYRLALNLAFSPMMKAITVGDVTESVRENVFANTLAIAQASQIQRNLASKEGNVSAMSDHIGFAHECNALLTLLYLDDPRYIPLPSPTRAGTGYDYPEQTHDLVVINQHWGNILKVVPVEIKAKASLSDIKRYKALIVRGKMHLSVTGKYSPEYTLDAIARLYEGKATSDDELIIKHATSTLCNLLQLYQKGKMVSSQDTQTRFHDNHLVAQNYPELSLKRSG